VLRIITKMFKLQKEYPPIHYSYIPPVGFPLPREYSEKIGDEVDGVYVEWIGLENFSETVQKNIRIKLHIAPDFEPQTETSRPLKNDEWNYDKDCLEITLKKLDPMENIFISLFHHGKGDANNKKPIVIINDHVLSKPMVWHGYARKYVGQTVSIALMLLLLLASGYWLFEKIKERPTFDDLSFIDSKLNGFVSCYPYVINTKEKNVNLKNEIKSSAWSLSTILQINEVFSEADLNKLDKIILCKKK